MIINCGRLKGSLKELKKLLKCDDGKLEKYLENCDFTENDVKQILTYLSQKLLDENYTEKIAKSFPEFLLLLVTLVAPLNGGSENFELYQRQAIALSKLIRIAPEVLRYSTKYFTGKPSPFHKKNEDDIPQKKKKTEQKSISNCELIKCAYNLLSSDVSFFRELWDWWTFLEPFRAPQTEALQRLYCNKIIAILTNMTITELKVLNENIAEDILIQFDKENRKSFEFANHKSYTDDSDDKLIEFDFSSETITNIEGVFLPIYNETNSKFYSETDGSHDSIVKVESTKLNLRSLALGVCSGKAICLSGPVGCGKTTLVEYLARKTGRIAPKLLEYQRHVDFNSSEKTTGNVLKESKKNDKTGKSKEQKRKSHEDFNEIANDVDLEKLNMKNGFLRVQLGDQTDSKMLLGQYRCTDVPGEFVWLPGVLTQAVMNGYWLLLEDLDSATQETCTVLSNLLENNFLSVPGFRDCVRIEPGFQLFVSIRTQKSFNNSQKTAFALLEKYLYTINIHPLSRNDLQAVISTNYPKLATISNRMVDVFLTFSSGKHNETTKEEENLATDYTALPHENLKLSSLPNSGRLVSTRDLIKLCRRSNPMFSVTSAECAYFVFQNAVDLFCSHLPQGPIKTNLIVSIGAKLGIIPSRCEFFSNEYKPDVKFEEDRIEIGRIQLNTKAKNENGPKRVFDADDLDTIQMTKRLKLENNSERALSKSLKIEKQATFSFTRLASCLLERIAVCVSQNEPILLVGETGVGKTSSVQYLAHKTNHKLIVVNMNNQSDVSDLIGGFKPVDLSYVIAPLRFEFEILFRETFHEGKNEKFLSHVSICFNRGDFPILIKLMVKIVDTVFQRAANNDLKIKNAAKLLEKWRKLQVKLLKLNSQLKHSINISFAFIPGSLVNCIKNGEWVLLDEINLASAETLECLSTILEPDGSVVLLEKGDLTPIKRHPDFRIFACMNPSTDIGKKDLPVGIRNRFTEFFVDELTTENDLMVLIGDYLSNTGIQKVKVHSIVKLYKKLRSLSELELNDGLGNRPVFSLRTLCRALIICAKNLCGSVERNLYESFCLSFLTQLDPVSHKAVLALITNAMISNQKAILSQQIPMPKGDYLNFEGYWIQKGPKDVLECESYILTESVKENLKDLARIISIGKLPILLQGPTSAGKTSLIEYVAKRSGNHCLRINNHEHTDLQEYIGTYTADTTGKLTFKEGVLVQAMRNGFWIILDELNLAPTDILEALNRVLDDNRELFIPETQTVVKAHPNFMLFATQNPPGLYGGRKTLSRAFKNRFIELHFSEIPRTELEVILEKRCLIPKSYSQKMVKCMSELKVNRKTTTKNNFTLRDLFRWGNRYTFADKKLLENNSYDWNQHLVDEGYLVLSAKVRSEVEIEIIEETLFNNFRKKINTKNLYSLSETTSMVTKGILESIFNFTQRTDIIWTQNLTRMAVLTAKALQFDEPVLLVGSTGCGKTTVCQILANIKMIDLKILNCHMHTEGADFLGGLRPSRKMDTEEKQLFEWADGPLVISMLEGSYFMADEISLAEDSVLERLNCVLEPDRTLLLAEKGGVSSTISKISDEFIVKAKDGFQFLATMNPGGDFGKKELSPALRNRFTEIWCTPSDNEEDMIAIVANTLKEGLLEFDQEKVFNTSKILIKTVLHLKETVEKFKFSIRDILAWANYLVKNCKTLELPEALIFGLETIFLDALEMLPHESTAQIEGIRDRVVNFTVQLIKDLLKVCRTSVEISSKKGTQVETTDSGTFGINPFFIETNPTKVDAGANFYFDAPTTKNNLFRLLSALSLNKAVLLEGPPGVGKTSIVESLARTVGYKIVRINLCEHTDLADLFGTDLPAEENFLDSKKSSKLGSFMWRDGPLLAALKCDKTWILLDELNLAPQSVLEGLNAILDHRGEVFIPELNKTFYLGKQTRVFASQNPLRQGGGRKGLPQSFLNRFTKVYLRKLSHADLLFVINKKFNSYFNDLKEYFAKFLVNIHADKFFNLFESTNFELDSGEKLNAPKFEFNLAERMVRFSEALDKGISDLEFGLKGGPFEINLRDILRWCELLQNPKTGFIMKESSTNLADDLVKFHEQFDNFLLILYERMKLVYYHRMRCDADKSFIRRVFSEIFHCDAEVLNELSEDVALYWTDKNVYLNDIVLSKDLFGEHEVGEEQSIDNERPTFKNKMSPLILSSQRELLKNLAECVYMEKPVILAGPSDCGKTKAVDALCNILNVFCNVDNIDDSVMGNFQQVDLNRHLEDISQKVESIKTALLQKLILQTSTAPKKQVNRTISELFKLWNSYIQLNSTSEGKNFSTATSDELILFKNRAECLKRMIDRMFDAPLSDSFHRELKSSQKKLQTLLNVVKDSESSLNTGGHFEWVDSKIVKSLKTGQYICLEHVNFCSSAVLDRLNPIFEPDGTLLVSEKGITAGEEPEIIEKHRNFRAFLIIDPKNGELSRAMRNRCIEISFAREPFTEDDLIRIVYSNGIANVNLMKKILKIHHRLKDLTELSGFNVSHLIKFAFLVASNKRLGLSDEKAVSLSAMEVYVYSSHVDLLGYGLTYYHDQLKTVIEKECEEMSDAESIDCENFDNAVITCDNLNTFGLIKLQCEPFRILVKNFGDTLQAKTQLSNSFIDLAEISFENNVEIVKTVLYLMYESSTFADVTLRHKYLQTAIENGLENPEVSQDLIKTNLNFYQIVKELGSLEKLAADLPWNKELFPRLRDYARNLGTPQLNQFKISGQLLCQLLLKEIFIEKTNKLKNMSALGYSKAVTSGILSDSLKNQFLQHLYGFLNCLQPILMATIKKSSMALPEYVDLITYFLWVNRLYEISSQKLFENKNLNEDLLDKLLLHFRWLSKHLLEFLEKLLPQFDRLNTQFSSAFTKLKEYAVSVDQPLNLLRKMYSKQFTNFTPLYDFVQVREMEYKNRLTNLTSLIPHFGSYEKNVFNKKVKAASSDEAQLIRNVLLNKLPDELELLMESGSSISDYQHALPDNLKIRIKNFSELIRSTSKSTEDMSLSYTEIEEAFKGIEEIFNDDKEIQEIDRILIFDNVALKEYFVSRLINATSHEEFRNLHLNYEFLDSLPCLNLQTKNLLNIIKDDRYKSFNEMWINVNQHFEQISLESEFDSIVQTFTPANYKNLSTFARLILYLRQNHSLNMIGLNSDICSQRDQINAEQSWEGPPLTSAIFGLLFDKYGNIKPIDLGQLDLWKKTLNNARELLWSNSKLLTESFETEKSNLAVSLFYSKKLLLEVSYIQKVVKNKENANCEEYNKNFTKLVQKLEDVRTETLANLDLWKQNHPSIQKQNICLYYSLINALTGSIELSLFTFTPLIDPVEKNRLKDLYINGDITVLNTLTTVYDFMKIVMNYKAFGNDIYKQLKGKIEKLLLRKEKFSKKLALRPDACLYKNLMEDINHFLNTNCNPRILLSLISDVENVIKATQFTDQYISSVNEIVKRLSLWIANSQRFLHHTMEKYATFYRDFVRPIKVSVTMVRFGFEGMKTGLEQKRNALYKNRDSDYLYDCISGKLCAVIENVIQFPCVHELKVFDQKVGRNLLKTKSNVVTVLKQIESSDLAYFTLLKAKLSEIVNCIEISSEIEDNLFVELNLTLFIFNQIWQQDEKNRRKRKAEEDSLYIQRTKCATEDEEEIEKQEINENFPTYVEEDFGEFIAEDTLEKVIKINKTTTKSSKRWEIMREEDIQFIGENFIYIMEQFSRLYYYKPDGNKSSNGNIDYLSSYLKRLDVFVKIVNGFKSSLTTWIDETLYSAFGFIVGIQQESLHDVTISDKKDTLYNFYKDSNIPEIVTCCEIFPAIEKRVNEQLKLHPDNELLNDIIWVIAKIRTLPSTSPVVRFSTGFQILRQKISQWNEVAHKNNHLRDFEAQVAEYIQRWTRLELQFWRNCIVQRYERVESGVYKYWFFIYNLLNEYLEDNSIDADLKDFSKAEKRFEDEDYVPDEAGKKSDKANTEDIINILRQFVESSNYADFAIRMKLLRSFEFYLQHISVENSTRRDTLISILRNLQIYFGQFSNEIESSIKSMRMPIEKKLKELVKIESYNKDLSYFNMRNNIARVHRNLNKFLKEYEILLRNKISPVFQQKENVTKDYNLDNDKGINLRYEAKIKYYMIDVKNFIASQKLKGNVSELDRSATALSLLGKTDKLFMTSRNVVKHSILNAEYPKLIYNLDSLVADHIETCDYLRNLEVDRSQEKPKQKAQAKHILTQKRKGLSDLYKSLASLGISFKTGLMESSMAMEFTDYTIEPFCVKSMFSLSKYKKLDQNLIYLNENLDNYYAKCVFKLKLLQNILLTPNAELGPVNLDRMKGFSVDLFLLIQKQRKTLSRSIRDLYDLRRNINDISSLNNCTNAPLNASELKIALSFDELSSKFRAIKSSFCKVRYVMDQFLLLLKCAPEKQNENLSTFSVKSILSQDNEIYSIVKQQSQKIVQQATRMISDMTKFKEIEFLEFKKVSEFEERLNVVKDELNQLKQYFAINGTDYLPIARPVEELLIEIERIKKSAGKSTINLSSANLENIDAEVENIIHSILLALQKIYKKHSHEKEETSELKKDTKTSPSKTIEPEEREILDNHLREKIHEELLSDVEILGMSAILEKLKNILLTIKYAGSAEEKRNYSRKLSYILPILEQFSLIGDYFLFQQLGAHKVSAKILSIMLTVFIELGMKGFCIPPDLMQDAEEGDGQKGEQKHGEGFGLEDGTGENDVSDKIESEDQLDDAKRPEDRKNENQKDNENCKEEKGIDMSEDFDANMQDLDKNEDQDDEKSDNEEEEPDKEMGETEEGAEKLDDQIWGSDEENEPNSEEEEDQNEEEEGKGSKEESDKHNDLSSKNEAEQGEAEQEDGLDAANENNPSNKEKREKEKDIDNMQDQEMDEEQTNTCHNELEEPPEAEDIDLGDNMQIDEENMKDGDENPEENPFDIDKMKENMDLTEEVDEGQEGSGEDEQNEDKGDNDTDSDSDEDPEVGTKRDDTKDDKGESENDEKNDEDEPSQVRGDVEEEKVDEHDEEEEIPKEEKVEEFSESKDKPTEEKNAQSIPENKNNGSSDQVQTENDEKTEQDTDMDVQDTGEEKEGIGQAENEESETGHQGIADTQQKHSNENQKEEKDIKDKRKQGNTNEERTLGEADKNKIKQLKTIDKLQDKESDEKSEDVEEEKDTEADEYQHVKEPKSSDKTSLDNATEEQSKKIEHLEDEDKTPEETENTDEISKEFDEEKGEEDVEEMNVTEIQPEKMEEKSKKPSKNDKTKEKCETVEKMDIEGEDRDTHTVSRGDDTTAHCTKDILLDSSLPKENTFTETLELRKLYQNEITSKKLLRPQHKDYELWQEISNKMQSNARELCEQLRLILEPTKCTRLKGDYRTGRRINMKKIIPYIASQFRKDKIWLRRTKPAQRDYKITITIDDSKSMHHNNSKNLTLEAISLVSQALTLLESGKLSIVSFGETPQIILNHTEQFDGPKLVNSLNFNQNQSRIAEVLDFVRTANAEDGSSSTDNGLFENLVLVLSDGRNIFSEGEQKVRNSVKLARLQRIFLVYIIIDNPENKHSILDIRVPNFSADRKTIEMKSYLDSFPFPYYVIVRDLGQLPIVLSEAMRQWFELVSSEQ